MAEKKKQVGTAAVERSTRVWMQWTPAYIRSAEMAADGGNFSLAARLADWLIADDRIRSTLETRVSGLLGKPFDFENDNESDRQVEELSGRRGMWWRRLPENKLTLFHIWGLVMGFAPGQNVWVDHKDQSGKKRLEPELEFWHPQNFRRDERKRKWFVAVEGSAQDVEFTPGDGQWVMHAPFGTHRPASYGYWRDLSRFALLKYYAISDWARHGERGSVLVATSDRDEIYPNVDTQPYREALAQSIYDRGREAAIVLPAGYDLKLVEARANTRDIYEAQINLANSSFAVLIRGGNLGTEIAEGGSKAAATSQYESGDLPRLRFDSNALSTTTRHHVLMPWAEYNHGDAELAPWPKWDVEPGEDLKEKAEIEGTALDNFEKARGLGFKVDSESFVESHNITWAKGGGEVDKKPEPPDPPPSGEEPSIEGDPPDDEQEPEGRAKAGLDIVHPWLRSPLERLAKLEARAAEKQTDAQQYVDELEGKIARHGARGLAPTIAGLLAEIDQAEGFDDMSRRIRERYGELAPPERLAELIDAAMKMSALAGHLAVEEGL